MEEGLNMTDNRFDPETERYMVDYMNQNHSASIYWYARTYGDLWDAENASMLAIDKEGMDLNVEMKEGEKQIRIMFDHVLADDDDAQSTLIEMSMKAREMIMKRTEQMRQGAG
ncbi:heme iron utilization protein [Candidatus Entotheonella serta]|nr:heme iron utilization protein [Candidatus Entotheonella serta]